MSGNGRETYPEVQEGSERTPEGQGRFGNLTQRFGRVERPTRRYRKGRETHPEVGEALRPTRRSGKGRETHPEVGEGLRPTRRSGKGWETHPEVRESHRDLR